MNAGIAEFDALHPNRRIIEPASIRLEDVEPATRGCPIFEFRVNLKIKNVSDMKEFANVEKSFFDIFEKRGLPYKV